MKVPISPKALQARINRRLKARGQNLRASRGATQIDQLGAWYLVAKGNVVEAHVDLEAFARKLGVLEDFEKLA